MVDVKIVMIARANSIMIAGRGPGVRAQFRVKVDFAESFLSSAETRRTSAIFGRPQLPRTDCRIFPPPRSRRLMRWHREVDDQSRQKRDLCPHRALVMESAGRCAARVPVVWSSHRCRSARCRAALAAPLRHDYPDPRCRNPSPKVMC